MSNYLIELASIHTLLILGYWLFLKNERQYHKMRFYLIGATLLSLVIPLLKLPKLFINQDQVIIGGVIPLNAMDFTPTPTTLTWQQETLILVYCGISAFLLLNFLTSLFKLIRLKRYSRTRIFNDLNIRKVGGIQGSFTFFRWIFLSEDIDEHRQDYEAILRHEKAHASMGHTYDLIFFEVFKIFFWWLPSSWYINKEIRKIHEYQADAYALKSYNFNEYSSILISSTLESNGLGLASSFHDGLILKRIAAMKQKAKNVSPWKLGILATLAISLLVVFACSEELGNDANEQQLSQDDPPGGDVFELVEEAPSPTGGMDAFFNYIGKEMKYPLQARRMGIEGKVFVSFVVEKDGSLSNVKALKGIGAGCDEEAVRVLQNAPAFNAGKQRGKPVRVRMQLPIIFKLNHGKTNPDKSTQGMIIFDKPSTDSPGQLKVETNYNNGVWAGKVFDEHGDGLPGANIVVEGTNSGAVTNLAGYFEVKADPASDLLVSFVGYQTVKVSGN